MEGMVHLARRALKVIEKYSPGFNCSGVDMIDTSMCENSSCCCFISSVVEGNGEHKRNQNKRIRHLSITCEREYEHMLLLIPPEHSWQTAAAHRTCHQAWLI